MLVRGYFLKDPLLMIERPTRLCYPAQTQLLQGHYMYVSLLCWNSELQVNALSPTLAAACPCCKVYSAPGYVFVCGCAVLVYIYSGTSD